MSIFSIGSALSGAWFVQILGADARLSRRLAAEAIAASIEARMRVNPAGVSGGHYTVSSETVVAHASGCLHGCDAATLAADDTRLFREALTTHLGPAADGDLECDTGGSCAVRIAWHGREVLLWRFQV
jgi:hypothetical protein